MGVETFSPNCLEVDCCVDLMQPWIDRMNGFTINLVFEDGSNIDIAPWEVSEVQELDDRWIAIRQNTDEYESVDTGNLTQKSRFLYAKHHHWGKMTVHKKKHCPLKS